MMSKAWIFIVHAIFVLKWAKQRGLHGSLLFRPSGHEFYMKKLLEAKYSHIAWKIKLHAISRIFESNYEFSCPAWKYHDVKISCSVQNWNCDDVKFHAGHDIPESHAVSINPQVIQTGFECNVPGAKRHVLRWVFLFYLRERL